MTHIARSKVNSLKKVGYVTGDLAFGQTKFMGVCRSGIAALQHCSIAALQHCSIAIALPQLLSHKTLSTMLSVEKLGQRKFIEPHHYDSLDVLKVSFSTRRHMILYMVHMHVHIFTYSVHTHTHIYI